MVGHVTVYGKVNPVNVLLLQGEVPMWNRNNCSQYGVLNAGTNSPTKKISTEASLVKKQSHEKVENLLCPVVKFEDGTKCTVSNKCTKITCRSTNSSMDMVLIVDINQCSDPVTATVTVNSQAQKWSHMFKDGEESDLIVPKGAIVKVSLSAVLKRKDDHIYVKVFFNELPMLPSLVPCPFLEVQSWFPRARCHILLSSLGAMIFSFNA